MKLPLEMAEEIVSCTTHTGNRKPKKQAKGRSRGKKKLEKMDAIESDDGEEVPAEVSVAPSNTDQSHISLENEDEEEVRKEKRVRIDKDVSHLSCETETEKDLSGSTQMAQKQEPLNNAGESHSVLTPNQNAGTESLTNTNEVEPMSVEEEVQSDSFYDEPEY